jgi:hypothetical protein
MKLDIFRCLTIRQPWAALIIHGDKDIENRTRRAPESLIGRIIGIHAGKMPAENRTDVPDGMPEEYGALLGTARIVGHTTASTSPWFDGPVGIVLDERRAFPRPIPMGGSQGFWRPFLSPWERAEILASALGADREGAYWRAFYDVLRAR